MVSLLAVLALAVTGVAALLAVVSAMAAARTGSARFAFAAVGFAVFALRGGLIVADGAGWLNAPIAWDGWTLAMDAAVVAALYAAVVKG